MGKTDIFLRLACELYLRHGCTTGWIRNKQVELSDDANFSTFLNDPHKYGWCPKEWMTRPDGVYTSEDRNASRVIEFKAISTFSNTRGSAHPDMLLCVLDEFMSEDGRYPKMCAKGLLSLANTMLRGREGSRIVLLSNNVSCMNPYYALFEIYPNPKYDVTVYKDKSIIIEQAYGYKKVIREGSPFDKLMRAGHMPQYEDVRADPLIGLVAPVPNGAKPMPWLMLMDGKYYREYVKGATSYFDLWRSPVPDKIVVYSPNVHECSEGVHLIPKILIKQISEHMMLNSIRFKDPNVMFKILSMVYNAL